MASAEDGEQIATTIDLAQDFALRRAQDDALGGASCLTHLC